MNIGEQEIRCSVESCRYNDDSKHCTLNSIMVGESCVDAQASDETECASFEPK